MNGNYRDTNVYNTKKTEIIKPAGTSKKLNTGVTDFTKVKNIYDLASNMYDWTTEAKDSNIRVLRGGVFTYENAGTFPASYRNIAGPNITYANYGTRMVVY